MTRDEIKALRAKPFPMQGGPSIPWELAERIYATYASVFGFNQSIERMAERSGFGWSEVPVIWEEYLRKFGKHAPGDWRKQK